MTITIFLITRADKTLVLEIDPTMKLIDLKHLYMERTGISDISDLKFHFHGSVMYNESKTLAEYGVPHEGHIREVPRLRGGAGIIPHDSKKLSDISGYKIKHKKTIIL